MSKRILVLSLVGLALGVMAPKASACWDNTDEFVIKLKKVKLSTNQLKEIFVFQKQHKAIVVRSHKEGLGCRYHENHEAVFQKQAVGVLTDAQFKTAVGRKRTKVESLTFEHDQLKKKLAAMQKRLAQLEALLKKQLEAASKKQK